MAKPKSLTQSPEISATSSTIVESILDSQEQQAEDATLALMDYVAKSDAFETLVKSLGSVKQVRVESRDFLPWGAGAFRFSVESADVFKWTVNNEERYCPVLNVSVHDGTTKESKALVGQQFRVSVHYGLAKALLDYAGITSQNVMRTFLDTIADRPDLFRGRIVIAQVSCDADGVPLKREIKGGRRILREAKQVVA